VWGFSPLFWVLGDGIPAIDLLVSRIIFAVPILAIVIVLQRHWKRVVAAYRVRNAKLVSLIAALLLATNWGVFIWAVTNEQVVAASLGYFINPLVSVLLGVLVLKERLRPLQWTAVGIAAAGVLGMAIRVGTVPWVALSLAFSFGFYGLLKKRPETPRPLDSLFGEIAVLLIPAAVIMVAARQPGDISLGHTTGTYAFLIGTGVITVIPLLLFGAAAKRIPLATVGLLQYIAPSIQLIVGVAILGETLNGDRLVGFVVVWVALALYTYDSLRASRKQSVAAVA
jgi:chloramphenicol-sensitive protein RarD